MKNKTSQTLFAYWNEIRGPRVAPNRFEIEPASISSILAETFILEHNHNATFRYRLAGTRICEMFGCEFRDKDVHTMWSPDDAETFIRLLQHVTSEAAVGVVSFEGATQDGQSASFEILALPVIHAGNTVTRILGSISVTDTPPVWIGHAPIVTQHINHVHTIWPDGKPHNILEHSKTQPAFSPLPEHTRVVSTDRARFRIYDGGRDSSNKSRPHQGSFTD